ncbi:MAG: aspartate/tyrosine/aromatic aminotransferase [Candidatus Omnitrophota bacterium]|jgi:aspartate/tyrosine/aromatic aminotransferase
MFEDLKSAPPDSILGLTEAFKADANPNKVNLGVGVYKDVFGKTPVLASVKAAEAWILANEASKSYLPITGDPAYGSLVQALLFGDSELANRVRTAHSPGGTGGLRVGADLIKTLRPDASVWVSTPTWANHKGIFSAAGVAIKDYRYYAAATHGVDDEGFFADLTQVPAGDIVLLHVCCHNPTGADLSTAQWGRVAELAAERGFIPFFDFAYQGFGDSVEADCAALQPFLASGIEFFVANSFSKNFGLYNERTGGVTLVARNADEANAAFSHLKLAIRTNYSNPSSHGGAIVKTILSDAELKTQWLGELSEMRDRIKDMRAALVQGLATRGVQQDFSFIEKQRGMFSFSSLSDEQVKRLRDENSIYIVGGGRINVAGLLPSNIDYICDAIAGVL